MTPLPDKLRYLHDTVNTPDTRCTNPKCTNERCVGCLAFAPKDTPDIEWKSIEKIAEEVFKKIQKIDIDVENGLEHSFARETLKNVIKEALSSRDTYWKERVRKEVEELWHELGKYQGWLGGVMGSEVDSTLMQQPPTKEVREAKALHTAIIMKAKEKVHQTQMKVKSLLDNLK